MGGGRIFVIIIAVIAFILALDPGNTVLELVAYAWAGLGTAFGPAVLFSIFSKRTNWTAILAGMIVGTAVLIFWKESGLSVQLYEIIPGFVSNCLVIMLVNIFDQQSNQSVLDQYQEVDKIYQIEK